MKRIRQRPVRSGGSGGSGQTMWVVRSDKDGDGRTKMGTNPDRWVWLDGPDNVVVRPDEDGDCQTKMGMAGQRWGRPDKDGDGRTKMGMAG